MTASNDADEKKHCDGPSSTSYDQNDDFPSSYQSSNNSSNSNNNDNDNNHQYGSTSSMASSTATDNGSQRRKPQVPKVTTSWRTHRGGIISFSSDDSDNEKEKDDSGNGDEMQIPSYHNSKSTAPKNHGHQNCRNDNETVKESTSTKNSYTTSETNEHNQKNTNPPGVSPDQERQILLLMLLAQVCALHDPTPRTFTVHVLELFERGILGRQSIHFLFELGLVPSTTPRLLPSPPPSSTTGTDNIDGDDDDGDDNGKDNNYVLGLTAAMSPTSTPTSPQSLRTREASVIRSHLEQHDLAQQDTANNLLPAQDGFSTIAAVAGAPRPNGFPTNNNNNHNNNNKRSSSSWAVEHHPLSLSRYQREFHQVRLLNSGSFGEVFQATSQIDLRDYAVKRVAFSAWGYSKDSVSQVIREVHCLAQCDHPNVVRYYTSWLEPSWMTGSGATMITSKGSSNAEVRHQQKLLTDIQHMMITGGADTLEQSQLQSQFQQNNVIDSENISDNNNLHGLLFPKKDAASWNSSIGSSINSLNCTGSSYDETSSEEDEDHYRRRYSSHVQWTSTLDDEEQEGTTSHSRKDSILFHSHRKEVWETSSSTPRRYKRQGNNANRKQHPARLSYRYQICLFIQMQLCHPATLADWIRSRNLQASELSQDWHPRVQNAVKIFGQIASGLNHIHKKNIVHRDLKPANLFRSLEENDVFLIGDFGLSKLIHSATHHGQRRHHHSESENGTVHHHEPGGSSDGIASASWHDPLTAGVGTASYAANEQVTTKTYGKPADIFSLGLILLELVCCFCTEHERMQTFNDCRNRRDAPSWIAEKYPTIANTILACTDSEPLKRPTAEQLLNLDLLYDPMTASQNDVSTIADKNADSVEAKLRKEIEAKDEVIQSYEGQLAEKDQTIEELRQELGRLKQSQTSSTETTHF